MENLQEKLKKAGLTGNEAKAYLGLLKFGSINGSRLAKKIGMDRTLTYQLLNNLVEKGLVSYIIKEHKKYFESSDPMNLLNSIKEKETFIRDLVPELKKIEQTEEKEQEINLYEGVEGMRTLMREIIKEKSFCSYGATGRAYDALYELPRLTKELARKGFKARIIMNSKYRGHKMLERENIEARFLNIESEATTTIFGDKVSIHMIKEKPIIIIIKNKDIANTYKNHFEFLWKIAK